MDEQQEQQEQQEIDDRDAAEAHQQELERRFEEEEWARWHREMTELLDNDPGYHVWLDEMDAKSRTEAEEYGGDGKDAILTDEQLRQWNLQQRINATCGF